MLRVASVDVERETGPLFRDLAENLMRRRARLWKAATHRSNKAALQPRVSRFLGAMRGAGIPEPRKFA